MTSLSVNFGGLLLKNPLIVASAPPTETVENIINCAKAGAAAVITKTIANFNDIDFPLGARRTYVDRNGLWATSTFRRETLTLEAGVKLVAGAVKQTDIPIIASVGALNMSPESWLPTCLALQDAGASMIQLDLFYIPHPRCSPKSIQQLICLLTSLAPMLRIPIAPKLNIDLPAHYASQILADTPIAAAFAIDSIRVPVPIDLKKDMQSRMQYAVNAGECSLFGTWQKPITLQYTRTLAESLSRPLCAGGGLFTGLDAIEAIMMGATTVQFATAIIQKGFKQINIILNEIEEFLDAGGYNDIAEIRGLALERFVLDERKIAFDDVKATVNHDLCIMCGRCTSQVFCSDIHIVNNKIEILEGCDGCNLCVSVCPTSPKALSLIPTNEWLENHTG